MILNRFNGGPLAAGRLAGLALAPLRTVGATPLFFYMGHFAALLLLRLLVAFSLHAL